ncbi:hypothetical protein GP486_008913 [Trichoglossum hirsutum]|uniref:DUF4313 domain-containing protein n=1 Tax=Trichoglossum hirsutum TaxID=265104 RepID=A0A9P8I087_9PEZI|nr:hypothetical protein GP486_008913 [Trichoglossum hirsutum]
MIINDWNSKYVTGKVQVRVRTYPADKSPAIELLDARTGEPETCLTVCMKDYGSKPIPGHAFIKLYSENEGSLEELLRHNLVEDTLERIDAGYVRNGVACVKLGPELLALFLQQGYGAV